MRTGAVRAQAGLDRIEAVADSLSAELLRHAQARVREASGRVYPEGGWLLRRRALPGGRGRDRSWHGVFAVLRSIVEATVSVARARASRAEGASYVLHRAGRRRSLPRRLSPRCFTDASQLSKNGLQHLANHFLFRDLSFCLLVQIKSTCRGGAFLFIRSRQRGPPATKEASWPRAQETSASSEAEMRGGSSRSRAVRSSRASARGSRERRSFNRSRKSS